MKKNNKKFHKMNEGSNLINKFALFNLNQNQPDEFGLNGGNDNFNENLNINQIIENKNHLNQNRTNNFKNNINHIPNRIKYFNTVNNKQDDLNENKIQHNYYNLNKPNLPFENIQHNNNINQNIFKNKNSGNNDINIRRNISFMGKPSKINVNNKQFNNQNGISNNISNRINNNKNNNMFKKINNLNKNKIRNNQLPKNEENYNDVIFNDGLLFKKAIERKINSKRNNENYEQFNSVGGVNNIFNRTENKEEEKKPNLIPNFCKISNNLNIFYSILIMLINNNKINNSISKEKNFTKIIKIKKNKKYNLSNILYLLNQYTWYNNISEEKLIEEYNKYINYFCKNLNIKKETYFNDINNIEEIINHIYTEINEEFTQVNKDNKFNNMLQRDDDLERFKKEFNKDNNSIISDNYMGFHRDEKYCCICKKYIDMRNQKNISKYQYKSFSYLCFELKKIYDYKKKSFTINNHIANINLDECFKYYNLEKLNVTQNNCFP